MSVKRNYWSKKTENDDAQNLKYRYTWYIRFGIFRFGARYVNKRLNLAKIQIRNYLMDNRTKEHVSKPHRY